MRACRQCGLSIGTTATFCPVCGALADPNELAVTEPAPNLTLSPARQSAPATGPGVEPATLDRSRRRAETARLLQVAREAASEARSCERTDPCRAVALYRQAIVGHLESSDDPLEQEGVGGRLVYLFDRLSIVLRRNGQLEEALEEIDSAAALGLLDRDDFGARSRRQALARRGAALRRTAAIPVSV